MSTIYRILFFLIFLGLSPQLSQGQTITPVSIDKIIASMTLEEKVGQMTQIDLGVIAKGGPCALENPQRIDTAKLRIAFEKYHVGSILNVGCGSGTKIGRVHV